MRQRKIQLLSLLLALALTVSLLPAYASAALDEPQWYSDGDEDGEYTISSAKELGELAQIVNEGMDDFSGSRVYLAASFPVTGDWTPIGTIEHPFKGDFNGEGHTVSGVKIAAAAGPGQELYAGFFGYCTGGKIENLTVEEQITVDNAGSGTSLYIGGLAGMLEGSSAVNCGVRAAISFKNDENEPGNFYIGGLVGSLQDADLLNCYHNGAVTVTGNLDDSEIRAGGLAGRMAVSNYHNSRFILNCYHTGKISASGYSMVARMLSGCGAVCYLQNCYYQENQGTSNTIPTTNDSEHCISQDNASFNAAQKVSGSGAALVDALNENLGDGGRLWTISGGVNGGYPVFADYWTDGGNYDTSWYDAAATTYTIRTARQLAGLSYLSADESFTGKTVTLAADIDLSGHLWTPIDGFSGTFEGAGHRITGMTVITGKNAGLINYLGNYDDPDTTVTVRNLGIENSLVKTTGAHQNAGGIAGYVFSGAQAYLYNCYSTAQVSGGAESSLLIGTMDDATVGNCYAINGTDAATGEYWSESGASTKTADELKGLTGTLNAWAASQNASASGLVYYLWHTSSSVNGGFPSFHEYTAPAAGGSPAAVYTITASAGEGGSISPSGSVGVAAGGSQSFAFAPADGYEVADVLVDGASVGAVTSYAFTNVTKGHTISVSFKKTVKTVYKDVLDTDWFKDAVDFVPEKGLMNGVGSSLFGPNMPVTRGMLVTILWRLAGQPVVNYAMSFKDVRSDAYYTEAVRWAASEKIVNGTGTDKFDPDEPVTREQLAAILYRYASVMGYDTTQGGMAIREFDDYGDISAYAGEAMGWTVNAGLLAGSANRLMPGAPTTRAQLAAILQRFLTNVAK